MKEKMSNYIKQLKEDGHFRNFGITIGMVVLIMGLITLPFSPMREGVFGEWLGFVVGASTCVALGSYSHRMLFKDLRPHLFTTSDEMLVKASNHRMIWVLSLVAMYTLTVGLT